MILASRLTPEGTRDVLFEQAEIENDLAATLRHFFRKRGYREVRTPGVEFLEVFSTGKRHFPDRSLYKLNDQQGDLLVLRADSTLPLARVASVKMSQATWPLRMTYDQSVFRQSRTGDGQPHERRQMGVELLGAQPGRSDIEILAMAANLLRHLNFQDHRFELGHVGLYHALQKAANLPANEANAIEKALTAKNFTDLDTLHALYSDNEAARALCDLGGLFGPADVLEKALEILPTSIPEVKNALDELITYRDFLRDHAPETPLIVDLGLIEDASYYSGWVLRAYVSDAGRAVVSGGRYDSLLADFGLNQPAIGFAVEIDLLAQVALARTTLEKPTRALVYIPLEDLSQGLQQLQSFAKTYELSLSDTLAEAKKEAVARNAETLLCYEDGAFKEVAFRD